jgi:hypothetical protein
MYITKQCLETKSVPPKNTNENMGFVICCILKFIHYYAEGQTNPEGNWLFICVLTTCNLPFPLGRGGVSYPGTCQCEEHRSVTMHTTPLQQAFLVLLM